MMPQNIDRSNIGSKLLSNNVIPGLGHWLLFNIYVVYMLVTTCIFGVAIVLPAITQGTYITQIALACIFVYLCDSFLNFPFTRPVMQIPTLFIIGLSVYLFNCNKRVSINKREGGFQNIL